MMTWHLKLSPEEAKRTLYQLAREMFIRNPSMNMTEIYDTCNRFLEMSYIETNRLAESMEPKRVIHNTQLYNFSLARWEDADKLW